MSEKQPKNDRKPENVSDKPNKTEKIQLSEAEFFQSESGKVIVYTPFANKIFISDDGEVFYEVKRKGFGGTNTKHDFTFENPHNQSQGKVARNGNVVVFNGETYQKINQPESIDAVPLPEIRIKEYSFTLPDGRKLVVTADKYNYTYEAFKLFIDDREIPIQHVERLRDGGTTFIQTQEGTLYVPSPFGAPFGLPTNPTWNNEEIKKDNS